MASWMEPVVYVLAALSILLALGGLKAFADTRSPGLLLSSIVSIVFSVIAIALPHWWPLVTGFVINIVLGRLFPRHA